MGNQLSDTLLINVAHDEVQVKITKPRDQETLVLSSSVALDQIVADEGLINKNGRGRSSSNFSTRVSFLFQALQGDGRVVIALDQVLISRNSFCTEAPPSTIHGRRVASVVFRCILAE